MWKQNGHVVTIALMLASGCDQTNTNRAIADSAQRLVESNGMQLNGMQLNGMQLNGMQLNGMQLNGMQLTGTQFNGYMNEDPDQRVSGTDLVGMSFQVTDLSTPSETYTVQITNIYPDSASAFSDVYLYDMVFQKSGDSGWTSLCQDSNGNAVPALPLANYWNMTTGARVDAPGTVTFACTNAALGKCVRWGYRPWATATSCSGSDCTSVSLQDYHQACTRMVRADYCGDGTSGTLDGTAIDVFDTLSPTIQTKATNWDLEARWTPDGATCVGDTRQANLFKNNKYPSCWMNGKKIDLPRCDKNDYSLPAPNLLGDNYHSE